MKKIILWRSLRSCDCKIYGGIYAADVSLWFVFLRGKPPYLLKKNSSTCCLNIHLHGTVFVEERVVKMLEKKLKKWWGVGRWQLLRGDWLGIGWWVVSRCLCINSFVCVYILYFILLLLLFFYFVFSVLIHSFYFNLWVLVFFFPLYILTWLQKRKEYSAFCSSTSKSPVSIPPLQP